MGKTPERSAPRSYPYSSSSTVGLRYRRKVPVGSDDHDAVVDGKLPQRTKSVGAPGNGSSAPNTTASKSRTDRKGSHQSLVRRSGDNQCEARGDEQQTHPTTAGGEDDNQQAHASPATDPESGESFAAAVAPYAKSRKSSTSSRKKKHKARPTAAPVDEPENQQQTHKEAGVDTIAASPSSSPSGKHTVVREVERLRGQEKKLHKRGAQDREDSANATSETSEPSSSASPSASRYRPTSSGSGKKGGGKHQSSLLKQLLWKAKPQQPKQQQQQQRRLAVDAEASGISSTTHKVASPDADESSDGDEAEEEEAMFTATQRQARKLQASEAVAATSHTSPPARVKPAASAPFVVESSSQETQSGSEDESFLPYNSLVSGVVSASSPSSVTPLAPASMRELPFFPEPFPLKMLAKRTLRVHEVMLEDFVFQPTELAIQSGDVVVWRVSTATPGMVEHCLEVTFVASGSSESAAGESASSSPLSAGSRFAWRFAAAGCASVTCSVYNAHGLITIAGKEDEVGVTQAETTGKQQQEEETENAAPARRKQKLQRQKQNQKQKQKQKQKLKNKLKQEQKRAAAKEQEQQKQLQLEQQREQESAGRQTEGSKAAIVALEDETADVAVFHSPSNLASEMDAGVCRAVLSQLEEVAQFIVVGDVVCPVVANQEIQETVDDAAMDLVENGQEDAAVAEESVSDFQQRVIAMLKRSEETQAQLRDSFVVDRSGFDAAAAYGFFKRRFAEVKSGDENVVYY